MSSRTGLVAGVLDGDLSLAVRPDVGHLAAAAHLRQPPGQPVRQHDRQRHQLRGVAAGIAEHQALVPGALPVQLVRALALAVLDCLAYAQRDVRRLRADRDLHAAGGAVEALGRGVVADLQDLLPDDARNVDIGVGRHLAGHMHLAGGDQRLDSHPAAVIALEHGVQNGVTDLVRHLVGMTLSDGLGSKETTCH